MSKKRLLMRKLREILRLKYEAKLAHRVIGRACGIGASTVSMYVQRAKRQGLSWPLPDALDDETLESKLFREPFHERVARPAPDCEAIHRELKRPGVTLQLLWLEYLEAHPQGYRYSQFCNVYRRWVKKLHPSLRQRHRAGEKVFVDYSGKRLHVIDPKTGELIPVELLWRLSRCLCAGQFTQRRHPPVSLRARSQSELCRSGALLWRGGHSRTSPET